MSSFLDDFVRGRYARVPVEVLLDRRLKPRHFIVLTAILLHANAEGEAHPTLATLSEITGIPGAEISRATGDLVKLGYLEKGQTGYNKPNSYRVTAPLYDEDDLREVTDKRMSNEDYQAKLEKQNNERKAALVTVTYTDGEREQMPYSELVVKYREALKSGCETVEISRTEFAKHGLRVPKEA